MKGMLGLEVLLGIVLVSVIIVPILNFSGNVYDHFFNREDAIPRGSLLEIVEAVNGLSEGGSVQIPFSLPSDEFYLIGKPARFDSVLDLGSETSPWNVENYPGCRDVSCICIWKYSGGEPTSVGWCEQVNVECISSKQNPLNKGARLSSDEFYLFFSSEDPLWLVAEKTNSCEGGSLLFSVQFK